VEVRVVTDLADRLVARGWRITPQRRAVLVALEGEHVHLSAEQVLAGRAAWCRK